MCSKSALLLFNRSFSSTSTLLNSASTKSYKLLVVGGGAGGCSAAAKFAKKLKGTGQVAIIEPNDTHYYQPLWTLVGGGLKDLASSGRPMSSVLPKDADWLKTRAVEFDPDLNLVRTEDGQEITYEYLVVAMGLQLDFGKIKGLEAALEDPDSRVGSNYKPEYALKTAAAIKNFESGNAVFTFPKMPIKCPGAPQKIAYITERQLTKAGKRDKANVMYFSTLPVIFGVKKYADALWKVVESRGIDVHLNRHLVEVDGNNRIAVFEDLTNPEAPRQRVEYEMLHATPPMSAPDVLKRSTKLTDEAGFVKVSSKTLQHQDYSNVFALGDCSSVATSKTAAAVAAQLGILRRNLWAVMQAGPSGCRRPEEMAEYDGYTSCPLVTGPGECILAEFDNSSPPQPMETFPFNQAKPMWTMYQAKANVMPHVYWQMLRGRWEGPGIVRKGLHLGKGK